MPEPAAESPSGAAGGAAPAPGVPPVESPAGPAGAGPESDPRPPPLAPDRWSGMPMASAASWSQAGGVSRKEVALRSMRWGRLPVEVVSSRPPADPYSSSYRRMTSPTGSAGHRVVSPLSRAMTSRAPSAGASETGPSARSSAQATKPRSNSRTRTSRCW
ncbi:hypothetical protein [Streptomyces sparsogenes]|uniref:hypothetical protein n=1 Tax=Streptomyces sparsogenes TaxID=67365 RepID=UPI001301DAD2|nr:hypothetical protein [Streptomyces sparsogenes]